MRKYCSKLQYYSASIAISPYIYEQTTLRSMVNYSATRTEQRKP